MHNCIKTLLWENPELTDAGVAAGLDQSPAGPSFLPLVSGPAFSEVLNSSLNNLWFWQGHSTAARPGFFPPHYVLTLHHVPHQLPIPLPLLLSPHRLTLHPSYSLASFPPPLPSLPSFAADQGSRIDGSQALSAEIAARLQGELFRRAHAAWRPKDGECQIAHYRLQKFQCEAVVSVLCPPECNREADESLSSYNPRGTLHAEAGPSPSCRLSLPSPGAPGCRVVFLHHQLQPCFPFLNRSLCRYRHLPAVPNHRPCRVKHLTA